MHTLASVVPQIALQDSRISAAQIAALAEHSLRLEIETWPKPGLVSHIDAGSHLDMDARTFYRSATALRPYFAEFTAAGERGDPMLTLRKIGLRAERAMLEATGGVNTHRGAIFGLGLLCAAAGVSASGRVDRQLPLGVIVSRRWGRDIIGGPRLSDSHGEAVSRRFGVGGARWEAARGFPSIYHVGLPALHSAGPSVPEDAEAARVQTCFALIASVEDTNILHRGGLQGLCFAQQAAQSFLYQGGVARRDWRRRAAAVHLAFVERGLSPGGAADLLAMSLFVMQLKEMRTEIAPP
jgi:triphosphoribosyl-dephospho-CoA synthase